MDYRGFCGPTYSSRSISMAGDRSINLFPELIESGTGKSQWALIGTPGLRNFCQLGQQAPVRNLYASQGRVLAACGTELYEVYGNQTAQALGNIPGGSSKVSIADNGKQFCIVSGNSGYILQDSELMPIAPEGFEAFSQVVFLDGYFVALESDSRRIWISELYDGFTWRELDFKDKESSPDKVVAILEDHGELWVFGDSHSEVWWNSGNPDFPLECIPNARIELGCGAPQSPNKLDNSIFWFGNDERGNRIIWRAVGYQAQRVSNHSVEHHLNRFGEIASAVGWTYQEEGHSFYVLQFPDAPPNTASTWVYDAAINMWHERLWWNRIKGWYESHRARCHCFAWNRHLVGDRENGMIYEQRMDFYDDAGDRIRRIRIGPHLSFENKLHFYHSFTLDMEVAVGLGSIPTDIYGPDIFGQEYRQ